MVAGGTCARTLARFKETAAYIGLKRAVVSLQFSSMSSQTPVEAAAMATMIIAVSLVAIVVAYVVLRLTGQERDATAIPGV